MSASRQGGAAARGARTGFTLVEVLVALAIVVIGVTALLGALTSAADTTAYLRDKTHAEWVGLNHLAETRLATTRPVPGKTRGNVDYAARKWVWQQEVLKLELPGALRIDVSVALAPAGAGASTDTTTELPWLITVSGIVGDAVQLPTGIPLDWSGADQGFQNDPLLKTPAGGAPPAGAPGVPNLPGGAAK